MYTVCFVQSHDHIHKKILQVHFSSLILLKTTKKLARYCMLRTWHYEFIKFQQKKKIPLTKYNIAADCIVCRAISLCSVAHSKLCERIRVFFLRAKLWHFMRVSCDIRELNRDIAAQIERNARLIRTSGSPARTMNNSFIYAQARYLYAVLALRSSSWYLFLSFSKSSTKVNSGVLKNSNLLDVYYARLYTSIAVNLIL